MKKLWLIVAIPVGLVLIAMLALVLLVNPNQFKPMIIEQVKAQTGLELVIDGELSWQFFPAVGLQLGHTELRNPAGFSQPNLFKVEQVGVEVSVMPLLSQQLEIGNVRLDGAEIYLETLADGRKNIDALSRTEPQAADSEEAKPAEETQAPSEPASGSDWSINLAGITISDALLQIEDKQAGTLTKLYDVGLTVSEFAFDQWTTAEFAAKGENNQQRFAAEGSAEFTVSANLKDYALREVKLDSSFSDPATQIDSASLELDSFAFDKANMFSYAVKGQAADMTLDINGHGQLTVDQAISKLMLNGLTLKGQVSGAGLPQSPLELGLDSDLSFDLASSQLALVIRSLTANAIALDGKADVTLADIPRVRFTLHSPNIDLDEFLGLNTAQDGQSEAKPDQQPQSTSPAKPAEEQEPDLSVLKTVDVAGKVTIDKFKASNARMQNVVADVSIAKGFAKLDAFSANLYQGSVKATATLDGRKSPASYTVSKQLSGVKIQPLLMDVAGKDMLEGTGAISANLNGSSLTPAGIQRNLVGQILVNFADGAFNGINVAQLIRENYAKFKGQSYDDSQQVQKTDFSAMKATINLNKGQLQTDDLQMQSPLLRVRGKGTANYLSQTVDATISTSVVGSLEGQGGKDIDELRDVTIPINVTGNWSDPKFRLVFDEVLKQKAQKEIDRGLKKLDDKLGDKIKDEKTKEAVDSLLKGLFN
ncbi:AsmA family protein [Vibrio sp.]|uniref:AsmA family protein n=1 Tax=Vibrio sp. TaxID=678 RepID=UPI003D14426A